MARTVKIIAREISSFAGIFSHHEIEFSDWLHFQRP